jgi:predicted GNAT family N-acyltransferase
MKLLHSLNENQIQQLHLLYQNEYWSKGRSLEDTINCIKNSSMIFALVENDQLLAFARVLTDYVFKALIFDVIVSPTQRAQGLGKEVVKAIIENNNLQKVRHIELYCLPELAHFYKQFGFTHETGSMQLMRREQAQPAKGDN